MQNHILINRHSVLLHHITAGDSFTNGKPLLTRDGTQLSSILHKRSSCFPTGSLLESIVLVVLGGLEDEVFGFVLNIHSYIWLHWVLVVARGFFS